MSSGRFDSSRVGHIQGLEKLGEVGIGELGPPADLAPLLRLGLGSDTVDLRHGPPLGRVGRGLHPVLLQLFLDVDHVARELDTTEQQLQLVVHL